MIDAEVRRNNIRLRDPLFQAYVHVTSNKVRLRGIFFGISALALAIMWIVFIVQILTGT